MTPHHPHNNPFLLRLLIYSLTLLPIIHSFTPSTTKTNKYEIRFDQMISEVTVTPRAIECVDSPETRTLLRGVAAAQSDERITNAFKIVYRDLAPVRVAGDLVFGRLRPVAVEASMKVGEGDVDGGDGGDGGGSSLLPLVDPKVLAARRNIFDFLDGDGSGGLDREEILGSPELVEILASVPAFGNTNEDDGGGDSSLPTKEEVVERFLQEADENGDGVVSFVEFVNATARTPGLMSVDESLSKALTANKKEEEETIQSKKKKGRGAFGSLRKTPEERFDAMLEKCMEWEQRLNCGPEEETKMEKEECAVDARLLELEETEEEEDGRLLQVLKGSLVGARCEPLVEALKMCYIDYSPLRLGGDIIFKLLGKVVEAQISK